MNVHIAYLDVSTLHIQRNPPMIDFLGNKGFRLLEGWNSEGMYLPAKIVVAEIHSVCINLRIHLIWLKQKS